MQSNKWELNKQDILKWSNNVLIFLAPALVIFLTSVQNGTDIKSASYVMVLWVINALIDLARKYLQGISS
jgi:hypothetical protein